MKYNINRKEKDIVEVDIEVDKAEWESALDQAYENTKGKYEVQGFRKGKAPRKAIENAYGSVVFVDDAIDEVYKTHYMSVLDKENLHPVQSPTLALDKCDDTGLKMKLTFQNKPSVELGAYTGLEIQGKKAEVKPEDVQNYIETMAKKNARKVEITDRSIQNGDVVNLNFSGSVDGEKFEGGTAENYDLEIGSHTFIDGFEDQMIGLKVGEEKALNVTFPKDYVAKDLAGKPAVFDVKINKIFEKQQPEIDDKWASMVSEFDTLEAFKKDVEASLLKQEQAKVENENTNALIDKIVEGCKFEVPECMIQDEIDFILRDFERQLSMQGMKMEDYLGFAKKSMQDLRDEQKDVAKINVGIRLVLENIIEKQGIQATESEIDAKMEEIAKQYNQKLEEIKRNISERDAIYIKNDILVDKLMTFLKENNKIKQ